MDREKPPFPDALRALAEEERRGLGGHPSPEDLVAYREGRLPPAAEEGVADHVTLCRECRELLLELGNFERAEPLPGEARPDGRDVDAAWQALLPKLREGRAGEAKERQREGQLGAVRPFPAPVRRESAGGQESGPSTDPARKALALPRSRRSFLPLAAGLLLAVGAGFLAGFLFRSEPSGSAPQANVALVPLFSTDDRSRGSEDEAVRLPVGSKSVVLLFNPMGAAARYRVEIRRGSAIVYTGTLVETDDRSFTLLVPRGLLPPGHYEARLAPQGEGQEQGAPSLFEFTVEAEGGG